MATGAVKWFAQGLADIMNKIHDFDSDDWRVGIVTTATVPTVATTAPHWGGTGTTNFATTQVATTGTSYTGPVAMTTESLSLSATGVTWRGDIITLPIDASGFTNGAWGVIYNNTDANKRAVAYVELSSGGTLSLVAGQVVIDWNGGTNDILNLAQA